MNSKREVSVISFFTLEKIDSQATEWIGRAVVAVSDSFVLDQIARDWATDATSLSEGMVIEALREVERQREERRASGAERRLKQTRRHVWVAGDVSPATRCFEVRTGLAPDVLRVLPEGTDRDLDVTICVFLDKESRTVAYAKNLVTDLASLIVYDGMERSSGFVPFVGELQE